MHDIGKVSACFQAYIAAAGKGGRKGPDHSTAGALVVQALAPGAFGLLLANAVAGHHAGLDDAAHLETRLSDGHRIEPCPGWEQHAGPLPTPRDLLPTRPWPPGAIPSGFSEAFLARMLFSCLVDADVPETRAFEQRAAGLAEDGGRASIPLLRDRLRMYMAGIDGLRRDNLSRARSRVLAAAVEKAAMPPGLFTFTVPTSGGKTLASLSFAFEHAARHGPRRVIHVAPFSALIEQTADEFRKALATGDDVLEHHAQASWREAEDDNGPAARQAMRAAENWDVPVVVTTAVIVLDEAQALPVGLLRPCMAALSELARAYGATVVLCTATQPAMRAQDGLQGGPDIPPEREIAPDPSALYETLRRVRVEVRPAPVTDAEVAAHFAATPQMLCIVNSRAYARDLFDAIRTQSGAVHLSTLMVPRHRQQVLAEVRRRAKAGEPARVVSTSLIEAGVDLSLPEAWRAVAGVDSIAQAAGRCNCHGEQPMARAVVFEPAEAKLPRFATEFHQAMREVLRRHDDLLGLEAVRDYFRTLYFQKGGAGALDTIALDGEKPGVLAALEAHKGDARFPFRGLAEAFRLIDEAMEPVVVPWDADAVKALATVGAVERPSGRLLRALLKPVHRALGEALLAFNNLAHYDEATGLDLTRPEYRRVEDNLF